MDDQWMTVWSVMGRACRAVLVPPSLAGAVALYAGLAYGFHASGASLPQVFIGAAFALLPGWLLASLMLAGGHALAVGWASRMGLSPARWLHQALCLLLSVAGIALVVVLANIGGGLMPYRFG